MEAAEEAASLEAAVAEGEAAKRAAAEAAVVAEAAAPVEAEGKSAEKLVSIIWHRNSFLGGGSGGAFSGADFSGGVFSGADFSGFDAGRLKQFTVPSGAPDSGEAAFFDTDDASDAAAASASFSFSSTADATAAASAGSFSASAIFGRSDGAAAEDSDAAEA